MIQFNNIPLTWKYSTIKDLIESNNFQIKNSLRKPISSEIRRKNLGIYPYLGAASIIDYINEYKVEWYHLLIAEDGTITSNGINPMLQLIDGRFNVSNHAHILQWNEKWRTLFLYYLLSNVNINPYITGAVQPKLSKENLLKVSFIIPTNSNEQKAITNCLFAFDNKIELLKTENKTLEQIAQTIFQEWFGKHKIWNELPNGWRVGKLWEVSEITSGKRPGEISEKRLDNFNIPLIWASKIMWFVNDYIFDWKTLIIWRVGTHGQVQRFNEKIYPSDNTLAIKSEYFNYVYLILKEIDYVKMNRWAVQPLITQSDLRNHPILIPSLDILIPFLSIVNSIFDKIENNNQQIFTLDKTRDAILPKLMKWEIRIKEFIHENY